MKLIKLINVATIITYFFAINSITTAASTKRGAKHIRRINQGSAWNASWVSLGGVIVTGPTVVSSLSGNGLDVFARGFDASLSHQSFNGSSWSGMESLGGIITSQPAAVQCSENQLDVFALGQASDLWHISYNGSAWSAWEAVGGVSVSPPTALCRGQNGIDVFLTNIDGSLEHNWLNGTSWGGWETLGNSQISQPVAVFHSNGNSSGVNVLGLGSDHSLQLFSWDTE